MVKLSKRFVGFTAIVGKSHIVYLSLAQLVVSVVFSASYSGVYLTSRPALGNAVCHVVRCSTNKEMIRSNASRVVAFVTDGKSIWNWSVMENPTRSIGQNRTGTFDASEYGWSFGCSPRDPIPASICSVNGMNKSCEKSHMDSLGCKKIRFNKFGIKTPSNQFFGCHLWLDNTEITLSQPRTSTLTV